MFQFPGIGFGVYILSGAEMPFKRFAWLHGFKKIDLVSQQRTSQNEQLSRHLARLNTYSPFVGLSNPAQTFQRM
jgi:hypothetical protein